MKTNIEKFMISAILVVILILLTTLSSYATITYCNPLNLNYAYQTAGSGADSSSPPFREAADPSVTIFNNQYYLFASKSWGYWYSSDLLNWTYVPVTAAQLPVINDFAPTVVSLDGYIYYKAGCADNATYIYRSSNPKDPNSWTAVPNTNYLFAAGSNTDAQFFYDSDTNRLFVTSGCSGGTTMYIQELDRQTFLLKGNTYQFAASDYQNRGFERPSGADGNNDAAESSGWTEGSQMFKYNGKYYYAYSLPDLGNGYCNGVLVGTDPMGPFTFQSYSPFAQKFKGFANGAGHGQVFQDLYGNWWNVTCQDIWVRDRYERRLSLFPTGFCADGQVNSDTIFGDYPTKVISTTRGNSLDSQLMGWQLLSKGRPATASSTLSGSSVGNAFDENIRTWWSAATGNSGEWLRVDLQSQCTVNALQVNFGEQDLTNSTPGIKYKIEMSSDGSSWTTLVDKWNGTTDLPHDYIELASSVNTRYLKLTINQMAFGGKCAVRDFRVQSASNRNVPLSFNLMMWEDGTCSSTTLGVLSALKNAIYGGSGGGTSMVNDDAAGITYTSWNDSNSRGCGDYNDDLHYSTTVGATAQYTFTGTGIDYIAEKYSDEGNVDVYIDNVFQTNVNLNVSGSRQVQQVVYSKTGLASGSHTIKIVNKSTAYGIIDAFKIYSTAGPQNGSIYHLICQTSGKALDNAGSTTDGSAVTQWADQAGNINQEWKVVDVGGGYYHLICQKSGKALDNAGSTTDGTTVTQWADGGSGNTNQNWKFVDVGGGYYHLICQTSGKALDNGGSTTDGTVVKQWTDQSSSNLSWKLEFIR